MLHFPELCARTITTLPEWPVDEKDQLKEEKAKKEKMNWRVLGKQDDEDY
jgi:hypothetical protein